MDLNTEIKKLEDLWLIGFIMEQEFQQRKQKLYELLKKQS